jgi:hypothetical protein
VESLSKFQRYSVVSVLYITDIKGGQHSHAITLLASFFQLRQKIY